MPDAGIALDCVRASQGVRPDNETGDDASSNLAALNRPGLVSRLLFERSGTKGPAGRADTTTCIKEELCVTQAGAQSQSQLTFVFFHQPQRRAKIAYERLQSIGINVPAPQRR